MSWWEGKRASWKKLWTVLSQRKDYVNAQRKTPPAPGEPNLTRGGVMGISGEDEWPCGSITSTSVSNQLCRVKRGDDGCHKHTRWRDM